MFLAIVLVLLTIGCGGGYKPDQVGTDTVVCCFDELVYHSNDSLLVPASIKLHLSNCDTAIMNNISSVVFPKIKLEDRSFFDLWRKRPDSNAITLIVNTNYFEDSGLSKDSIEHILSERIGIVISKNDTIYVERCR